MKKFIFIFAFALLIVPSFADALSTTNRIETANTVCSGTLNKSLTSTDGTFDGIAESQLPADYATVGTYCISMTKNTQCMAAGGGTSYSFNLYNTSAAAAYSLPASCTQPTGLNPDGDPYEKTSPPRIDKSTLRYLTPSATLTASPTSINQGSATLLTWSSTNASSCTGTNFSTGGAAGGSLSVSPSVTTAYSVMCGSATDDKTVTVIQPLSDTTVSCSASPTSVSLDDIVTWVATVTGGTAPFSYLWAGDGALAEQTVQSPQVSYSLSGVKSGSVMVTDSSSIPSSTTVTSTWRWSKVCSGTPTGYGESDIQDGGTYQQWRNFLESHSQYMYTGGQPADFAANPQNYCVQANLTANCPPTQSGTCIYNMSWDIYSGSGTITYDDWVASTQVSTGQNCSQSWTAPYCYQEFGGTRTFSVSNAPSSGPAIVNKQCSNTVTVNGGPTTPTFATPGLTCPASVIAGEEAEFTLSASDPDGDQIHYGMDWDNTSSVDEWKPSATTYVASGVSQTFSHTWDTAGSYPIQGLAEDIGGNASGWAECEVEVVEEEEPPAPECSDTLNNDTSEDNNIDYPADLGCTSLLDPTEFPNPQCSDGADNDNDELEDTADQGCHSDGNAGNPGSYNPNGISESASPLPQCSDGVNNDGVNGADCADLACHINNDFALACDPSDDNESMPKAVLSIDLLGVLLGDLIRPQTRATITWTSAFVTPNSCSVTGNNLPIPHDQWFGDAGQEETSILSNETIYTLRCLDLAGVATSTTQVVGIAPSSGED